MADNDTRTAAERTVLDAVQNRCACTPPSCDCHLLLRELGIDPNMPLATLRGLVGRSSDDKDAEIERLREIEASIPDLITMAIEEDREVGRSSDDTDRAVLEAAEAWDAAFLDSPRVRELAALALTRAVAARRAALTDRGEP